MATKMTFTDSAIARIKAKANAEYYSDKTYRGLRLLVSSGGSKVWYASKWDGAAQKSRQTKVGQFPHMKRDEAWRVASELKARIDVGGFKSKAELVGVVEEMATPTLAIALEEYIEHQMGKRASGKASMQQVTADEYRRAFNLHLATWASVLIDDLPTRNINQHLNALQRMTPHAAFKAHAVVGATLRHAMRVHAIIVPIPSLTDITKQPTRDVDRDIDWADRWAEIDAIENPIRRACWKLRWITGVRENVLRALTWDDVDLAAGTVTYNRIKRDPKGRTIALSEFALSLFRELHDMTGGAGFVFPSPRGGVHIDRLRRKDAPLTAPGDLRHLWNDAAFSCNLPYHVQRWLNQQNLKDKEIAMLGHYGQPDIEAQRIAADKVAAYIMLKVGLTSNSVVALQQTAS
jgi:integrase